MPLRPVEPADASALAAFLADVDLTTSGLDAPAVRLWIDEDAQGRIVASTGYEASADGVHALVRSVAVLPGDRGAGRGTALATFAIERAREDGATAAWLFSRRSGPFWQGLGFERTTTDALAAALGDTHQVRLFARTGQLQREVAWRRELAERTR